MKVPYKLEKEILGIYHKMWDAYFKGDAETFTSYFDDDVTVIGSAESEFLRGKVEATFFYKLAIGEAAGKAEFRNRNITLTGIGEQLLILETPDVYILINDKWTYYGKLRLSSIARKQNGEWKFILQHGSLPDAKTSGKETIGFETISKENRELRDAIKRNTKELEIKIRELEIEASLEKVRSRSLAMQKSEELVEASSVLFEELKKLEIDAIRTGIGIYDSNTETMEVWSSQHIDKKEKKILGVIPIHVHPSFEKSFEAWQNKAPYSVFEMEGDFLKKYYSIVSAIVTYPEKISLNPKESFYAFYFSEGSLNVITHEPLTTQQCQIITRFATVFGLTYRRFKDLALAEAQAKEAQIELALEKIRTRTMAMHKSEELKEVIRIVFQQLKHLNIHLDHAGFVVDYLPKGNWHFWIADDQDIPSKISHPYFDSVWATQFDEAKKEGKELFITHLNFEEKNKFYEELLSYIPDLPKASKDFYLNCPGLAATTALFDDVSLYIENFSGLPYTDEENKMLMRFGKVFQQTYTRFLDLQTAEAQAKEAQIEMALEKVRSRSLAMHTSKELQQVVNVVYDQLNELGLQSHAVAMSGVIKPQSAYEVWVGGSTFSEPLVIPYTDSTQVQREYNDVIDSRPELFCKTYSGEIMKEYFEFLMQENEFPSEIEKLMLTCQAFSTTLTFAKNSGMQLVRYSAEPFTDAENKLLIRFQNVFEQAYVRFMDLQKAEAQAREAQIETALERVRARSMAMHQTDELSDVLCVLFEQFDFLGINPVLTHLTLMDEANETFTLRITTSPKERVFAEQKIDINAVESWKASFENWKKREPNTVDCIDYPPEVLPYVWEVMSEVMNALPEGYKINPEDFPDGLYTTQGHFKFGYLGFNHSRRATEEEKNIVSRFAIEFGRVYQRFLDIQKAEAQAKESEIQLALERVRAKTMAMHNSNELGEVASVLFEQISILTNTPDRFNIGIANEEDRTYDIWVTDQQGHKITKLFVAAADKSPVIFEVFEAWKRKEDFIVQDLHGKRLEDWVQYMGKEVGIPFNKSQVKDHRYINSVFFSHGFIGITTNESPNQKTLKLIERFAKVFQQTYTRFLDLQKAEAQAREAQIQLALERVRAKAMAMRESEELTEVLPIIFEQLDGLGVKTVWTHLTLIDIEKNTFTYRMTGREGKRVYAEQAVDLDASDIWKDAAETFKSGSPDSIARFYFPSETLPGIWEIFDGIFATLPEGFQIHPEDFPGGIFTTQANCVFGYIGINNTEKATEEEEQILFRFAKEFGRLYQRFLDLQKAEAQTREAQIESSLERIRAKSMAMQHTEELNDVISLLCEQYDILGIHPVCAHLSLIDIENDRFSLRLTGKKGARNVGEQIIDVNAMPVWAEAMEKWKKAEPLSHQSLVYPPDEVPVLMEILNDVISTVPEEARISAADFPDGLFSCEGQNKFGNLGFNHSRPPTEEEIHIVVRFAREFERIYQRFLDLEKAEAQAKEAQIETGLERVRSRTMAMQSSDELSETAAVMFQQLISLGIAPNRLFIGIIRDNSGTIEAWATNEDGSKVQKAFTLEASKNESVHKMYEGWLQQNKSVVIDMHGKELEQYFQYLAKELKVPFQDGLHQKRRIQTIAYFSKGLIGMASTDEQPKKTMDLLERFAAVFNLTYTRFNDLKISEAHAIQAKEDLIKLQTEKRRAEEALANLKAAQSQLVQSEKMASLGELTAGIAHEIQNPLNFVNNFSDVNTELIAELNEAAAKGDIQEVVAIARDIQDNEAKILHHGKRADAIVKGMLQHSRASGGIKEPTDINALADEYLRLAYHGLRAKDKSFNATMKTDFDPSLGKINVIPQDIGRVILNLITNAFYVVNEKKQLNIEGYEPTVTVSSKIANGSAVIRVTDNGNGIPQQVLDKIFQPFFTTKPTGQGTGLGLSLAFDIVTKGHSGELRVETKEGEGTTFIIQLPNP